MAEEEAPVFMRCRSAEKTLYGKFTGHYLNSWCGKKATEAEVKKGEINKWELHRLGEPTGEGYRLARIIR
jgi:hypothetical protein